MTTEIEVTVTCDDSRDEMYAELFSGNVQCAEIRLAGAEGEPVVTVYPPFDGKPYEFAVVALQEALTEAVSRLRKLEGK